METALHEFVRRVEHCLAEKKPAMGIFLDIPSALDNVTLHGIAAALRGLDMSKILPIDRKFAKTLLSPSRIIW